jgi:hypothetical protein
MNMSYKDWFKEQQNLIEFLVDLDIQREDTDISLYLKIVEIVRGSFIYPLGFLLMINEEGRKAVESKLNEYNLVFEYCIKLYEDSDVFAYTCFNIRKKGYE